MIAPGFTGADLDRVDHLRSDRAAVAALAEQGDARLLTLAGLDPVLDHDGQLAWSPVPTGAAALILLGLDAGAPVFAPIVATPPVGMRPKHLLRLLGDLGPREAAIWGTARALNEWHNRHRFCGICGSATDPFRAGWGRRCSGCGADHFPRVDPVVIMLAQHDGRVLVGRQPRFPPRRYSALAGFVEPGESIEEAVARELFEEAGVRVANVRYVASQPWPFPSQLMIACIADAADDTITLDETELEDAFWVDRPGVNAALSEIGDAPFLAPPAYAIAHTLLRSWVEEAGQNER